MQPQPDPRWRNIVGGIAADGTPVPMSFEILAGHADTWRPLIGGAVPTGIRDLLATSRSLFAHSWFNYEFMVIACPVSLQAVEAALRQIVFPEATKRTSVSTLVDRAERDDARWRGRRAHPGGREAPELPRSSRRAGDLLGWDGRAGHRAKSSRGRCPLSATPP